jgi:hypothetical protein
MAEKAKRREDQTWGESGPQKGNIPRAEDAAARRPRADFVKSIV